MEPFVLRTDRFLLDQPGKQDEADIAAYCSDPVFERFLITPWPYERADAEAFVREHAPGGWERNDEWTWAIRDHTGGPLLGVVGIRLRSGYIGYWLGAPHRGRGVMPEAVDAVCDAVFIRTGRDEIRWECVVGNVASMRVAQKVGFRYTGEHPSSYLSRDGSPTVPAWTGALRHDDLRTPKPGWPAVEG